MDSQYRKTNQITLTSHLATGLQYEHRLAIKYFQTQTT